MSELLPRHVIENLERARRARRGREEDWRVEVDGRSFPVLRRWANGFSIEETEAPRLRGLVDLYQGTRHVAQCLVVAADANGGERRYEVKRATPVAESAPRDFAPDDPAPGCLGG